MSELIVRHAVEYLRNTTGIPVGSIEPYNCGLPPFLEQVYRLHVVHSGAGRFLLIEYTGEELITPLTYGKHLSRILRMASEFDSACVVFPRLPFYVRQRYARKGIAFIVPGIQLNWPHLGLALQQRSRSRTRSAPQKVLPATQLLLLYALVHGMPDSSSVKELSQTLSYSPMTISRAFDQVDAQRLGQIQHSGRERIVTFNPNRRELWHQVREFLDNPVTREVRLLGKHLDDVEYCLAGESALARYTTLAEPPEPILAVSPAVWRELKQDNEEIPICDDLTCIVQVWRYNPGVLQHNGVVDPYSLWLSMRDSTDERLHIALDQLLDKDAAWPISKLD